MKRILMVILAMAFALGIVACQDVTTTTSEVTTGQTTTVATTTEQEQTTTAATTTTQEQTTTAATTTEQTTTEEQTTTLSDTEMLQAVVDAFDLTGDLENVSEDLTLPDTFEIADISWSSNNTAIITDEGVVTQPTDADTAVTLTATFTYNAATLTKTFEITVLKFKEAPVLTVPEDGIVTMILGDSDSLELATATDLNDGDLTDQIVVSGTFDINLAGFYAVTLTVTDSDGDTDSADVVLQVQYESPVLITGETWNITEPQSLVVFDVIENFEDGAVFNIAMADGVIQGITLFHNTSDQAATISVINAYGVGAILNANGVVIEGRDGANGRLVDDSCGLRTLCAQGSLDATNPLSNMVIPAGGFAIVAPNANTSYNEDGRKFVNEQINNRLGRVVPMYEGETLLYTYQDQAPFVVLSGKIQPSGTFTMTATKGVDLNILDGLQVFDDNGQLGDYVELVKTESFNPIVSVKYYDIYGTETVVTDPSAFSFALEGVYDLEITITDGTNETLIETQITVIVFEELSSPAFRIVGDDFEYIDLMKVPYTYNFEDTNDIDTGSYHIYDSYDALVNDTTLLPHAMGWGSFIIFDAESGVIEVNYNIFHANVFVADGVDYIDTALFADNAGLKGITNLPAGKILLVGPQNTQLRSFALGNTSRDLTGLKIEFINVPEVPSIVPQYDTSTLVINYQDTAYPIVITGYAWNPTHPGTNNMPTGKVEIFTDYNNILGLDGTPLNMGWGSYMVIDELTKTIEVYANWGAVYTIDGVDYVDAASLNGATVLDTLTSLPAGKILIVSPQGTDLRNELYNTIGNLSDITGTTLGMFEVYSSPSFVLEYNGEKYVIDLAGYTFDPTHPGTNNMPTGAVEFVTSYANVLGLDGTPVNMGYGSYLVIDTATMTIEVYANWGTVFTVDGVDYVDAASLNGATVLDTLTSLPEGKLLIICPQSTDMRNELYNTIGNLSDITGLEVKIYLVDELN